MTEDGQDWEARVGELGADQRRLVEMLARMRAVRLRMGVPSGFVYAGMHDFLLRHGVWHRPSPWTGEYPVGAPRCCYGNSLLLAAAHGLGYVEGVALAPNLPIEFQHGWNIDAQGVLVDSTWRNEGLAYLGVEFSAGRLDHASWNDDATILDNPRDRFALYREPWRGEDFARKWKPSEGLLAMRRAVALGLMPKIGSARARFG